MTKRVLLLGVRPDVLEPVKREIESPEIEILAGSDVSDTESAFRQADIDLVIIGGGLDLEARAEMVRTIFQSSDRATIHMKDQMSGPEGLLPFVKAVLAGLGSYEPGQSPHAILRAERTQSGNA